MLWSTELIWTFGQYTASLDCTLALEYNQKHSTRSQTEYDTAYQKHIFITFFTTDQSNTLHLPKGT